MRQSPFTESSWPLFCRARSTSTSQIQPSTRTSSCSAGTLCSGLEFQWAFPTCFAGRYLIDSEYASEFLEVVVRLPMHRILTRSLRSSWWRFSVVPLVCSELSWESFSVVRARSPKDRESESDHVKKSLELLNQFYFCASSVKLVSFNKPSFFRLIQRLWITPGSVSCSTIRFETLPIL